MWYFCTWWFRTKVRKQQTQMLISRHLWHKQGINEKILCKMSCNIFDMIVWHIPTSLFCATIASHTISLCTLTPFVMYTGSCVLLHPIYTSTKLCCAMLCYIFAHVTPAETVQVWSAYCTTACWLGPSIITHNFFRQNAGKKS